MEQSVDLETKYKKIATEYSKVKSQAMVLKKALLEEQAKSGELGSLLKELEQKIRKSDQEMESLAFRNDQLTKRISVLQRELQEQQSSSHKKHSAKNRNREQQQNSAAETLDVHNEELHKKIVENARLINTIADKDLDLECQREKTVWLESRVANLQKSLDEMQAQHKKEMEQMKKMQKESEEIVSVASSVGDSLLGGEKWQKEAERWKQECELMKAKPESNADLSEYYENYIREAIVAQQKAQSEVSSLWAESLALSAHLENAIQEKETIEQKVEKYNEDISTINDNYRTQLDAMTEHLASLNDTITRQSDQIQHLQHQLSLSKK